MSTTQSIIVYRNPLEAALWEGGYVPVILFGIVVFFAVFFTVLTIGKAIWRRDKAKPWGNHGRRDVAITNCALIAGAMAGIGTMLLMVG